MREKKLDYLEFLKAKEYIKDTNRMQLVELSNEIENRGVVVSPLHLEGLIVHCYGVKGIKQLIENLKFIVEEKKCKNTKK
jgi:hypothetical protein